MANAVIQKRLAKLEAELKLLRRATTTSVDFSIDEKNWKKMRPAVKKIRAKLYKERYG